MNTPETRLAVRSDAFLTHSRPRRKAPRFEPRPCACGCGEVFQPTRAWQEFKNAKHRKAAWLKKHAADHGHADILARLDKAESELAAIKKRLEIGVEISRVFDKIEFKDRL